MFDLNKPWITITSDPEDDYAMTVKHHIYDGIEERVDLGPNPTWPSPDEINDLVAEAVRRVLDKAWEAASGEPVVRPTVTTRPLGHYEQMQIDLALQIACSSNEEEYDSMLERLNPETLTTLLPLFASHGTVSVTRTEG